MTVAPPYRQRYLKNVLKRLWPNNRGGDAGKGALAAVLLAFFLFVLALALCEPLHAVWHPDALDSSHHCAITLLQSGQLDTPTLPWAFVPVWLAVAELAATAVQPVFPLRLFLPPACGPPA